ncbi:MAG: hypothetical protein Q6356_003260 [Candidatus Wukongarchaeota archaeon]|nr:hypothetical protein [Candidatus Wukongarchaeota archaeon]
MALTGNELTWFIVALWCFLLAAFYGTKKQFLGSAAGLIGLFLGLTLIGDSLPLGAIFLFLNVYLVYVSIMTMGKR